MGPLTSVFRVSLYSEAIRTAEGSSKRTLKLVGGTGNLLNNIFKFFSWKINKYLFAFSTINTTFPNGRLFENAMDCYFCRKFTIMELRHLYRSFSLFTGCRNNVRIPSTGA